MANTVEHPAMIIDLPRGKRVSIFAAALLALVAAALTRNLHGSFSRFSLEAEILKAPLIEQATCYKVGMRKIMALA